MFLSKSSENMFIASIAAVCFLISINSINASPVKGLVASIDSLNDTITETLPSLPLEQFGQKYYYVGAIYEGNYFQAVQFCNSQDMKLLSLETKEENDILWDNLKTVLGDGEYHFWTSGTILPNDNHWVWLSTGKPIMYTNWSPNQPDNAGGNEKCLEIGYTLKKELKWNDHECNILKNVICETSLPKADSTQLAKLISSYNLTLINVPAM